MDVITPVNIAAAEAIPGWMRSEELRWLAEQAQQCQVIVEVGSWQGRSTRALCDHCPGTVYAIDAWVGHPKEWCGAVVAAQFHRYLDESIALGTLEVLYGRSEHVLPTLGRLTGSVDLLFLDGDHDYEAVKSDIALARPLLRPGGILSGHDYDHNPATNWPGVARAVDEAFPDGVNVSQSIWWVRV